MLFCLLVCLFVKHCAKTAWGRGGKLAKEENSMQIQIKDGFQDFFFITAACEQQPHQATAWGHRLLEGQRGLTHFTPLAHELAEDLQWHLKEPQLEVCSKKHQLFNNVSLLSSLFNVTSNFLMRGNYV